MKLFARIGIALIVIAPSVSFADILPPPPPPILSVNVADHCTASDSVGTAHTYVTSQFLGICALVAAQEQNVVTAYSLQNFSFGLMLISLNGTAAGATEYWKISQNGTEAAVGLSDMTVASGDTLSFQLTDWMTSTDTGSPVLFKIGTLISPPVATTAGGGGGGIWMHPPFDVQTAFRYLESIQNPDGSFGSPMLNDWVAIASALGESPALRAKLTAYEVAHPVISTIVTDNERHAMALQALGINPYSGTPVDYIEPIVRSFDGTQFGDPSLVNDDIFAIFPLLHAGYETNDPIIASTTAFILSKQGANGLWNDSVDLTAAAIQALALVRNSGEVRHAISKATGSLRGKQVKDGSFGDPYSSSWMLQAIAAMNGTATDWQQDSYTPDYYLATLQDSDGGVHASSTNDRVWATAYAIPAIRRATWDSLLSSFAKPVSATIATSTVVSEATPTYTVSTAVTSLVPPQDVGPAAQDETVPSPTTEPPVEADTTTGAQAASAALSVDSTDLWQYILLVPFLILLTALGLKYRRKRGI
ncbi:hypothetical protein A3C20_01830 [Candidatus Kaiserbacteria bacterium RIFCSPHIGHO2_02_FULL_55_25]|uniref:Transcobalamin-like C-terminal domain-containing protein n=1 Tax=Candidatus Kaiserbacteria bacterium RIFCSPHIGHO2_02_FULL_55_25 TaxID=1798498 RepID=A0A1F6E9K4_9BACT|nr:MAG: hypothetical protein A2764_00815 [Candidatus Kaiserbacteria bacterium RIFCSPHIGHO2_01_FULL_55_79]OGG70383.1 MAG: hypothetical protein A3C20_01830 [Candidatus Kaiserbacteria bacterium RIFCSPHIGHO2_02_FULL_55_25]OGG78693.1 MAG: hypothetical protein A3F56_01435 [Candidatus Kaiserbacteria bacterium RIFCSPHIGHO2_12_FULL_55_13]OGG84109.1 MAG: hypothetical protein A3A42_04770 [Candidatus Kaiserbacteria bacterium RIFCSPLOWO2_01_FULL_55_25]